ncbi:MAG: hypothetical protein ABI811_19305 [Acidobacteriota bacterium]
MNKASQEAILYARKYRKVVIWGLRRQWHSHRFIHQGFYETFRHLGIPVVWTDFTSEPGMIEAGDFVITSNVQGRGTRGHPLAPLQAGAYYCFHGYGHSGYDGNDRQPRHEMDRKQALNLEVYVNKATAASDRWDSSTYFDKPSKTLHQAWGTNVPEEQFRAPVISGSPFIFWVGAIWNNALNQGNLPEIEELRSALKQRSLRFVHLKFIPDWVSIPAVRASRVAPAIAGKWQVEHGYLPCRMFKNISYGQLGFSNVPKFSELYGDCTVPGKSVAELVDNALSLSKKDAIEMIAAQQKITRQHTYVHKIRNIFRAMAES